jgi:hypothetical protein
MTDENQICNAKGASKILLNRNLTQEIIPVAVFAGLWLVLVANLSQHWATNPEYGFGWFVPVLCAYLFLMRWRTRPPAESARSIVAKWIFWTAGIALLPTCLIAQPNPDWRLISWLLAIEIVAFHCARSISRAEDPGSDILHSACVSYWRRCHGRPLWRLPSFKD